MGTQSQRAQLQITPVPKVQAHRTLRRAQNGGNKQKLREGAVRVCLLERPEALCGNVSHQYDKNTNSMTRTPTDIKSGGLKA